MTKGQFTTATYFAEVLSQSKQLKFSTIRKLIELSKQRQALIKQYHDIKTLGQEKEISDDEIKNEQEDFLLEEYTEPINVIYANTLDNLVDEEMQVNGTKLRLMNCLIEMMEVGLIKE